MTPAQPKPQEFKIGALTPFSAALITGFSLLAMLVLAPPAYYHYLPIVDAGDNVDELAHALEVHGRQYLIGIALLFGVYLLDVLVAWGLYGYFKADQNGVGRLIAWTRLIYATLALVSLSFNLSAYEVAQSAQLANSLSEETVRTAAVLHHASAETLMSVAWAFFGIHLMILSVAIFRSFDVPFWVGVPVLAAGSAYTMPIGAGYFAPQIDLRILSAATPGELVFMFWLFFHAWQMKL